MSHEAPASDSMSTLMLLVFWGQSILDVMLLALPSAPSRLSAPLMTSSRASPLLFKVVPNHLSHC